MTGMFRSTLILTLVCLIAAALLGAAYTVTEDKIAQQQDTSLNAALKEVLPDADKFDSKDDYFIAKKNNEIIGYAVQVEQTGYGGKIKMLVGIDTDKKITGLRIMEHEETPGLGANAAKPKFYSQFDNLGINDLALSKDNGKIDAITGATITSRAVIEGAKKAFDKIGTS